MDAAHLTAINDVSRAILPAQSRSETRVSSIISATAAAAAFTLAAVGAIEGWAAWKSWSQASSIRLSLRAVQTVTATRWAIASSSAAAPFQMGRQDQILTQQASPRRAPVQPRASGLSRRSLVSRRLPKRTPSSGRGVSSAERGLLLQLAVGHRVRLIAAVETTDRSDPLSPVVPVRSRRVVKRVVAAKSEAGSLTTQRLRRPATEVAPPSVLSKSTDTGALLASKSAHSVARVPSTPHERFSGISAELVSRENAGVAQPALRPAQPASSGSRDTTGSNKLRRYTKPIHGNQWLLSEGPALSEAAVLYTPSNVSVPRHLPRGLTTHQERGTDSRRSATLSGWISNGARVTIVGGKRPVRYFSEEGREVGENSPGEKFFVAEGLRPGAGVARAMSISDGRTLAAAGVPVLAGKVTQVDLRAHERRSVGGVVLDSRSTRPRGVPHAEVRVVGLPDVVSITDASGRFDFGQIPVLRGLPTYLEVRLSKGFTHRYALSAEQLQQGAQLFYFSPQRVARWLQSLEGGVSEHSGLIVASVPRARLGYSRPVAVTQGPTMEVEPETYWLDSQDQLHSPGHSVPGDGPYAQWIGLNITGPAALVGLQSPRNRWVEAHWMPISPGVVSVLSPSE